MRAAVMFLVAIAILVGSAGTASAGVTPEPGLQLTSSVDRLIVIRPASRETCPFWDHPHTLKPYVRMVMQCPDIRSATIAYTVEREDHVGGSCTYTVELFGGIIRSRGVTHTGERKCELYASGDRAFLSFG